MISPIKFALVNLLNLVLAPFAPLVTLFITRQRGSALEEEKRETHSRIRTPPSKGDDPESIDEWLARGKTILAGYRRDFGPDSWLTKRQAEYVRELQRMSELAPRSPDHNDGPPRMADGV